MSDLVVFLQGVSATASWAAGMLFLRFWRESADRLFAFFGVAFFLLAASWTLLATLHPTEESRPYIYLLRLVAFMLIIAAMIDKNRSTR